VWPTSQKCHYINIFFVVYGDDIVLTLSLILDNNLMISHGLHLATGGSPLITGYKVLSWETNFGHFLKSTGYLVGLYSCLSLLAAPDSQGINFKFGTSFTSIPNSSSVFIFLFLLLVKGKVTTLQARLWPRGW
jgi:hypothetical protein